MIVTEVPPQPLPYSPLQYAAPRFLINTSSVGSSPFTSFTCLCRGFHINASCLSSAYGLSSMSSLRKSLQCAGWPTHVPTPRPCTRGGLPRLVPEAGSPSRVGTTDHVCSQLHSSAGSGPREGRQSLLAEGSTWRNVC